MSDDTTTAPPPSGAPAADALASPPPPPSWRDGLSEDLRGNPVFANYGSLDDFAKGHISTKQLASSKVPMPGDTPESFKAFTDAVRPADATVYDIPVPEGMPTEFADGFRKTAHELGLLPQQVKALAEWNNSFLSADIARQEQAALADLNAFKTGFTQAGGNYDAKLDAVKAWLPNMGIKLDDGDMAKLDAKLGSGNLMRFMFTLHDQIGDLPTHDGGNGQGMGGGVLTPQQAEKRQSELFKDASWRQKAQVEGSAEWKENERLTMAIARGRHAARNGRPQGT